MRNFLLAASLVVLLVSCGTKAPDEAKYIPKDANMVVVFDPLQVKDKLQKGEINVDTLLNKVFSKDSTNQKEKTFFKGFQDSAGFDWSRKVYFFMKQKSSMTKGISQTFALMAGLKSKTDLEKFIQKHEEISKKEIKKGKAYSWMQFESNAIISWNDKQVILLGMNNNSKPDFDTATGTWKVPPVGETTAQMEKQIEELYNQSTDASMASVKPFAEMFKEKADAYVFSSSNGSLEILNSFPINLPGIEALLKDNYSISTLNFADGKVEGTSTTYVNDRLGNVLKQYAGPVTDFSSIENYPSDHLSGVFLASFNPNIVGGLLKELEVQGLADEYMKKIGLSTQDIYKSLKGNISVAFGDIGYADNKKGTNSFNLFPKGKLVFHAAVGDKTSFIKIMNEGIKKEMLVKNGNQYKLNLGGNNIGIYFQADEKEILVASDSLTAMQFLAKTTKTNLPTDVKLALNGKSVAFYADINRLFADFSKDTSVHMKNDIDKIFKDVIGTMDNYKDGKISGKFELRLNNEKQNSLVTFIKLATNFAADYRNTAKASPADYGIDTMKMMEN